MHTLTNELIEQFNTRNPIDIAEHLGINVIFGDLGSINGYYIKAKGFQFIKLNEQLEEKQLTFTAAHELGHALLHDDIDTTFLNAFTEVNTGRFENEANQFAVFLLISDEEVEDYKHLPVPKLMEMYNIGEKLVHDRFMFGSS